MLPNDAGLAPTAIFAGDFRILKSLSQGGMGAVYIVEQLSTGKQRALKLMLPQLVADPALRRRFEQEARIGSKIESEHVVEVVGAGVDAATQTPWLAMELLSGSDLADVLSERGALGSAEVLSIFEQLCHAVGAAHRAGIVHRDLKPENVFLAQARRVGSDFTVKVLDFGIAKIVAEAKTAQTAAMGSPLWMAPEQTERAEITPASDVWALGLIAFNLLTGRYFWVAANGEGTTVHQLMREILFEAMPSPSTRARELGVNASLPPGFDQWFAQCVSREPAKRPRSATEAMALLRPVLSGEARIADTLHWLGPATQGAEPTRPSLTVPDSRVERSSAGTPTPSMLDATVPRRPRSVAVVLVVLAASVLAALVLLTKRVATGDSAARSAIPGVAAALSKLPAALTKASRASCERIVTKLCSDLPPNSQTCTMVKEKTPTFPNERCAEMLKHYEEVLAQLKDLDREAFPASGGGAPGASTPPTAPPH